MGAHALKPQAVKALELAQQGMCVADIARQTGYSHGGARLLLIRNNTEAGRAVRTPSTHKARSDRMASMYRQGLTLEKIGQHFELTRERVRQILRKMGVTRYHGGRSAVAKSIRQHKRAGVEARSLAKWGVSFDEMQLHRAAGLVHVYTQQRNNANRRGIVWGINFAQWLGVWNESGKLEQRGRGKGHYVMSRMRDAGGYVMGNVHIQLSTENNSEGIRKALGNKAANTGVWNLLPGTRKPWQAAVGRKRLGFFETEAEAVAARNAYLLANPPKPRQGYAVLKSETRGPRYQVVIARRYIGTYTTPEAALAARQAALAVAA